jgi:hypothetical protein
MGLADDWEILDYVVAKSNGCVIIHTKHSPIPPFEQIVDLLCFLGVVQ